jgi:hypothetical protein
VALQVEGFTYVLSKKCMVMNFSKEQRVMDEAPENGRELSHFAYGNGMNE